jgi:hypothetical protein
MASISFTIWPVMLHWQGIVTFIGGIAAFPVLQRIFGSAFEELRKRWVGAATARRVVATQLDPLLKAADELQGKLRSLAEEDFREFLAIPVSDLQRTDLVNLCSTLYLFAQFWGRLEILRRESFHAELARNKQGRVLLPFLRCLESRRVRLVDRSWQRAIGESIVFARPSVDVLTFKAFVEQYETDALLRGWVQPLEEILRQTKFRRSRQRVLQYGVIVHALIDTLDPKHYTTGNRPAYPNKLSRRAKRELTGRVFGTYLPKVRHPEKYTGVQR